MSFSFAAGLDALLKQDHKIIEEFKLEGTFGGPWSSPCSELDQVAQGLDLWVWECFTFLWAVCSGEPLGHTLLECSAGEHIFWELRLLSAQMFPP